MPLVKSDSSETLKEMEKPDKVENSSPDGAEVKEAQTPKEEEPVKVEDEKEAVEGSEAAEAAVTEPEQPAVEEEAVETAERSVSAETPTTTEETAEVPKAEAKQTETEARDAEESEEELLEIARKLYNEEFVLIRPEEYTQFLAADDKTSEKIRELYMDLFDWSPSLLRATRTLCLKLYLKGESQEIDRILSAFTRLYIRQNPVNVFGTRDFEKIYIILYSLILLNTALHNGEINKKSSISQSDYVRTTFSTFLHLNSKPSKLTIRQKIQIERELHLYYDDLARNELYLKKNNELASQLNVRYRLLAPYSNRLSVADTIRLAVSGGSDHAPPLPQANGDNSFLSDITRQRSNNSNFSEQDQRHSLAIHKTVSGGSALSHTTATSTNAGYGNNSSARVGFTRVLHSDTHAKHSLRNRTSLDHLRHYGHNSLGHKSSKASIISRQSNNYEDQLSLLTAEFPNLDSLRSRRKELENFDLADFQDSYDLELEMQGSPYLKEGLLKLRIYNNDQLDFAGQGESQSDSRSGIFLSSASVSSRKLSFFSFFKSTPREPSQVSATVGTHSIHSSRFTDYFVVVSKGELRLYSFDPKNLKKQSQKLKKLRKHSLAYGVEFEDATDDVGDGNWLKNAANMGNYNLCLTSALLERLSLSQLSDAIQWSLTFPKTSRKPSKKFIFEAGTVEIATEFVNACNFWAAKITAVPPIEESVTSLEYGWTNLDGLISMGEAFKKHKNLSRWEQIPKGIYISNLSTADEDGLHEGFLKQFLMTLKYYNSLKSYYNNFSQLRTTFLRNMRKYASSSNFKLISNNFEGRANEYKGELTKYKSYVIMLGYGLKLRFDAEEADVYERIKQDIMDDTELTIDKESDVEVGAEVAKRLAEHQEAQLEVVKVAKKEIEKLSMLSADLYAMFRRKDALPESRGEPAEEIELPATLDPAEDGAGTLVKLPKNFSLADIKDENSPISQLLLVDVKSVKGTHGEEDLTQAKRELIMSFSTNTIKEEDEESETVVS